MKKIVTIFIILLTCTFITITFIKKTAVEESMIYFPLNDSITFNYADTSLMLDGKATDGTYKVNWDVNSSINKQAYLRQDISLLYVNGRLKKLLGDWKQNSADISLKTNLSLNETAQLNAISFHHGEIHEKGQAITSVQHISDAELYVIDSKYEPLHSFITAKTKSNREWKKLLNDEVKKIQAKVLKKTIDANNLDESNYDIFYLTDLDQFISRLHDEFNTLDTERIIGQLWEGVYKNYYVNIKKADNTTISPIGSTIPLILLDKNSDHLFLSFEDINGNLYFFRQNLASSQ